MSTAEIFSWKYFYKARATVADTTIVVVDLAFSKQRKSLVARAAGQAERLPRVTLENGRSGHRMTRKDSVVPSVNITSSFLQGHLMTRLTFVHPSIVLPSSKNKYIRGRRLWGSARARALPNNWETPM